MTNVRTCDHIAEEPVADAELPQARIVRSKRYVHGRRGGGHARRRDELLVTAIRDAADSGVASGQLARMITRWAKLWRLPELRERLTFRKNLRLRTTVARWVIQSKCIELSARFLELRCGHDEILCHEMAHAAAVWIHGRAVRPHGTEWRGLVSEAGYEPKARRASDSKADAPQKENRARLAYEHRCSVCHAVRYARKPVSSWRCVECVGAGLPGHLTIEVVPRSARVQ
jgi:predicted SprT family Zn-dependent metalloprotease